MIELEILQKYWGYSSFRDMQGEIISSVMEGNDTLCILPTGGGKSVCFQVPALAKEGICIVISPLIALMNDQVGRLKSLGIKAVTISGYLKDSELEMILDNCMYGAYKFLYLSPEKLENEIVRDRVKRMPVNLIAVDEAHCVSHWGKDFRPSYLKCSVLKEWFPKIPMIALTASATDNVKDDIVKILGIEGSVKVFQKSLRRENLAYMVYKFEDRLEILSRILKKNRESSIVYVGSRDETLRLSNKLKEQGFTSCYYHGGLTSDEKYTSMNLWLYGDCQVMVATNAFGMGIDKADVRTVIHWSLPHSIEDYYQEAGRAGRDGKKSFAVILLNNKVISDFVKVNSIGNIDVDFVKSVYRNLCNYFGIAIGDGDDGVFRVFDLSWFCNRFDYGVSRVYKALEFLENNEVIAMSRGFTNRVYVQMLASSEQVIKYTQENKKERLLVLYLLRTYTGISEQKIDIKIVSMSKILEVDVNEVIFFLNKLKVAGMIDFENKEGDMEICFLKPRDDDRTINPIAKNLIEYNNNRARQVKSVLDYVQSEDECKERFLLEYFGQETREDCGRCSYCVEKKMKNRDLRDVKALIIRDLEFVEMSFVDIGVKYSLLKEEVTKILEEMMEEGLIFRNSVNKYSLKK